MQKTLKTFLQSFIYLLCSRCEAGAFDPLYQPQKVEPGSGSHCHNGELADLLGAHPPSIERIGSAYLSYLADGSINSIARGYNNPAHVKKLLGTIPDPEFRALVRLHTHRDDTWLRHGLEHVEFAPEAYRPLVPYPPKDSRFAVGNMLNEQNWSQGYYAVDVDRWPFVGCTDHWIDDDCGQPWAYVAGYIPLQTHVKYHGTIHNTPDRDHYYARAEIPAEQWTFIWRQIPNRAVKRKEQQTALYAHLLPSTLTTIELDTLKYYMRLVDKLQVHAQIRPLVQ